MDVLVEMTHESLKDIGVSAYGHRHKILRGIKDLQARIPERRKQKGSGKVHYSVSASFNFSKPPRIFNMFTMLVKLFIPLTARIG